MSEILAIGSPEREALEGSVLRRASAYTAALLVQDLDALDSLGSELSRTTTLSAGMIRTLVDHVEQCWATAILR